VPGPESEAHEYAFEMYAQGQKYNIVVDDEVPIFNPGTDVEYAIFAESKDHIMWGPILEKAYAKFVGSYEKNSERRHCNRGNQSYHRIPRLPLPHSSHFELVGNNKRSDYQARHRDLQHSFEVN